MQESGSATLEIDMLVCVLCLERSKGLRGTICYQNKEVNKDHAHLYHPQQNIPIVLKRDFQCYSFMGETGTGKFSLRSYILMMTLPIPKYQSRSIIFLAPLKLVFFG